MTGGFLVVDDGRVGDGRERAEGSLFGSINGFGTCFVRLGLRCLEVWAQMGFFLILLMIQGWTPWHY